MNTTPEIPASMKGRAERDIHLRVKHGHVLESKTRLRDTDDDSIRPERCPVCQEMLHTHGQWATHCVRHTKEGTMVATLSPTFGLVIDFMTLEKWEERNEYNRLYRSANAGSHPTKRILPEGLDTETNLVRPKCMVCGNAATMRLKHLDESITDHEAVIAYAPDED